VSEVQGQQLVFSILDPVEGKGAETQRLGLHSNAHWSLSPNGNKIAIIDTGAYAGEALLLTLAAHKIVTLALRSRKQIALQSIAWSADGSHLFATALAEPFFEVLLIDMGGNMQVLARAPLGDAWLFDPIPSPDGHYLAYMKRTYESNVVMLENF